MIRIDRENEIAWIELKGGVDIPTIKEVGQAMWRHPDRTPRTAALWDFRKADLSAIRLEDLEALERWFRERQASDGPPGGLPPRVAFVVSHDADFGIARMWENLVEFDLPEQARRVFRDVDEAVEWLLSDRP